jgi:hypothetical protein
MTHRIESQHLSAVLQGARAEAAPSESWLGESAPEDFLREVVDTLEGFLREASEAPEPKTGDTLAES